MLGVSSWLHENKQEYERARPVQGNEDFIITQSGEPVSWEHRQISRTCRAQGGWKNLHLTPLSLHLASLSL